MVPCGTPIQDSINDQLKAMIHTVKGLLTNERLFVALRREISVLLSAVKPE